MDVYEDWDAAWEAAARDDAMQAAEIEQDIQDDMRDMADWELTDAISDMINAGDELPDEVAAVWADDASSMRDLARLVRRDYPELLRDIAENRVHDALGW